MAPLRVLCVHGYRQNSNAFRDKTGALRKLLKKHVELVFINAPHYILPRQSNSQEKDNPSIASDEEQRGWWFSNIQERSFDARQECESSLGLAESLDTLRLAVKELGPFDGILGFSQGAALVAMICALQERKLETIFNFRFAILVAGFRSACAQHQHFYEDLQATVPSLHVFGQEDKVIPEQMSRDLLSMFPGAHILTHPGGHFIPATSAHRQIYQEFLQRFQ
ncbi:esterase OVCA2 [Hoplias malabaricus]|uniref:esterase OVCA2 n=1 Tax=Hoplias malabaricus TaxID=27720 RepID=UPI0034637B46